MSDQAFIDKGFSYQDKIIKHDDGSFKWSGVDFPARKVWIQTYGCQMNYADSERIISHLHNLNFTKATSIEEADLILFNTCAIRDHANQKFYSHLGEAGHIKKRKNIVIGIGGCVAQTEGQRLVKKYPHLDFAFGTDAIDQLPDLVYRAYSGETRFFADEWDTGFDFSMETRVNHGTPQAFVNITKGCNNFCTYCIVPYARGREKSRGLEEVVSDVKNLVENSGIREVTLLGQNVNSFGKDNNETLAQLIVRLNDIDGLEIIRYTTSHPYDMSDELIAAHGTCKKLANHVHLPLQSGSDTVLKRMNRKYSAKHFLGLIEKLRAANSDIVITSDIIAGFPNETEEEHLATMAVLDAARFDNIYAYAFSPRPGTKAAEMEDCLNDKTRNLRLREIQARQLEIQAEHRAQIVGREYKVLVDGTGNMKGIKKWKGRTNCMRIVHFEPNSNDYDYLWHWVRVRITSATSLSCQAEFLEDLGKA